ncbi:restriction endonuclease subunit S [Eubacterium callanderi]|uniref:restriction endonuclease subunit S n=1 Tax=Eubacterium callanderi TaxID=53442 RepID=UPI00241D5FCE|nr:restriction endonuclease subunit S [Eubacterium callanderi]
MGEPKLRFKADDGSDFPDWEGMTLGDVGSVAMCKRVFKEQTREVGDVPFFKIGTFGGVPDAYISKSLFDELKSKYAYPEVGTILLSASGTIGRQVEYKGEDAYYQDSNIVWLEHDDTVLDSYLKQFYSVVKWQGLEGSTIKRLYNKTILDTPFYRPSLPEQRKIADLLSAVDDVISAQEAEVAAWEKRKKGVMQKLFSQEVRFKADDGSNFPDWEEKTLGNLGTFLKGAPLSKSDITDEGTPLILYGELYTTYAEVAYSIARRTDKKVPDKFYSKVGDVVIPTSGETPEEISTATCVMKDGVILAGDLYIYRPATNVDGRILSYLLNHQVNNAISRIAQGKSVVHVQSKELERIHVIFPSSPIEQRKIADCLASLDDVIAKAKDELDAWRELKKGLLQQMFV